MERTGEKKGRYAFSLPRSKDVDYLKNNSNKGS